MPTPHISAELGDIAPAVLFPGDPRRAEQHETQFNTALQLCLAAAFC